MKAREAATEARLRADESQQVIDYLTKEVFGAAAHGNGRRRSVTLGELLDQADKTVAERFRRQPLVEAAVRIALAGAFSQILSTRRAEQHVARAAELRAQHLGPEHPATLAALAHHAYTLSSLGWGWRGNPDTPEAAGRAEQILLRTRPARLRVLGPDHPDMLWCDNLLAQTVSHLGRQEEAEGILTRVQEIALRVLGPEHEVSVGAMDSMAMIAQRQGDLARAEDLLRQSLAIRERSFGKLEGPTIGTLKNLAFVVRERGRADEARMLYVDTVGRLSQVYGISHIQVSSPLGGLLELLRSERDYAAIRDLCEGWLRELLAMPPELDQYERDRRSIRLRHLVLTLATLPEPVPFDAALAVRAAEEADAFSDHKGCLYVLAMVHYRLGELDLAEQIIRTSTARSRVRGIEGFEWLVLALIHARRGKMASAHEAYSRAIKRQDEHPHPWGDIFEVIRAEATALLSVVDVSEDVFARP
jgi:tetratricopeptide (TPR) repeat protein